VRPGRLGREGEDLGKRGVGKKVESRKGGKRIEHKIKWSRRFEDNLGEVDLLVGAR